MKKEIDFQTLSLKDYRNNFCKGLSLEVLRRAYCYSQQGHRPENAISTAATLYAEPFKSHNLLQQGLMVERNANSVMIWNVQTETMSAQRALLQGQWNLHNRVMCIARLGENYDCTLLATLEISEGQIVGIYEHGHRFAAVICLKTESHSAQTAPEFQKIADIIAQNALAYHQLGKEQKRSYRLQKGFRPYEFPNLPDYKKFLLKQPCQFAKENVSIAEYLEHCGQQLKQNLTISKINVFGDFEHL